MTDRKLKAAKAAFDTSIDCGITLFDTAEVYGSSVRTDLIFLVSQILKVLLNTLSSVADGIWCYQLRNTSRQVRFLHIHYGLFGKRILGGGD